MIDTVIKIENLSKEYRLGQVGTGTISHDLNRWWCKIRGKDDPYLKIGETNDRAHKGNSDYVYALKDINLEIKRGEILGIIGGNGAGKSTLLKILSKVTGPTTGSIKTKGRIASLLEVGTGFHPELTGRENIYMNGTIMGMTRKEISSKLGEIIEFAGVERYLDTPVKRYSSGMTVRLGFAVAAHLEPEILVVDEVLAVGDAEFQKKAIGKMKEVSKGGGRTVLFVSHNMQAIKELCNDAILLRNGKISDKGNATEIVNLYISNTKKESYRSKDSIGGVSVKRITINGQKNSQQFTEPININELSELNIAIEIEADYNINNITFAICFDDLNEKRILTLWSKEKSQTFNMNQGLNQINIKVEKHRLLAGNYTITTYIEQAGIELERINNYCHLHIKQKRQEGVPLTTLQELNHFKEEYIIKEGKAQ